LQNAVQARQPVAIFDIPERSLLMMIPFLFTPVYVALATPFIRPFQWKRLFWTYVIPVIPFTCWWDGLVSACRAYKVAEMLTMRKVSMVTIGEWVALEFAVRSGSLPIFRACHTLDAFWRWTS
jgi:hypothetical protein